MELFSDAASEVQIYGTKFSNASLQITFQGLVVVFVSFRGCTRLTILSVKIYDCTFANTKGAQILTFYNPGYRTTYNVEIFNTVFTNNTYAKFLKLAKFHRFCSVLVTDITRQ